MASLQKRKTFVTGKQPPAQEPAHAFSSDRAQTGTVQSVVENALQAGDVNPIIKLVFDLQSGDAAAYLNYQDDKALDTEERPEDAIVTLLQQIADRQNDEINLICRANAEELSKMISDTSQMRGLSEDLKQQVVENNDVLQTGGVMLLTSLEDWHNACSMDNGLAATHEALSIALPMLGSISRAARFVANLQLYKAFKVLQRLQEDTTYQALHRLASSQPYSKIRSSHSNLNGLSSSASVLSLSKSDVPQLGVVSTFIVEQVQLLMNAIGAHAMAEFNEWLVKARSEAGKIGLKAIRRAAAARQLDEVLLAQRQDVLLQMGNRPTLESLAKGIVEAKAATDALREGKETKAAVGLLTRTKTTSSPVRRQITDVEMQVMVGLDMTPLHRCVQVHKCLGELKKVVNYYFENRALQLRADLEPPTDFLNSYQTYISQIVGFFVVEDQVSRSMEGGNRMSVQVDAGWEVAVSRLKSLLEGTFEGVSAAAAMLMVKDFMLLAISALSSYGYHVSTLNEILVGSRSKYLNLLNSTSSSAAINSAQRDQLFETDIPDENKYKDLCQGLGLPLVMEGKTPPTRLEFPMKVPWSSMVPELVRLARRYIMDISSYLTGLVSGGEVLPAVRQNRDKMLQKIIAEAIGKRVERETIHRGINLEQCMMLVNDSIALQLAMADIDLYTMDLMRGHTALEGLSRSGSMMERQASGQTKVSPVVMSTFQNVRSNAEKLVIGVMTQKVSTTLRSMSRMNWMLDQPERPSTSDSPYVQAIMLDLKQAFNHASYQLPRKSFASVVLGVFSFIGDAIINALATDPHIAGYNIFGIQRLFSDIMSLRNYAESFNLGLIDVMHKPFMFCEMMLLGKVEELEKPPLRNDAYLWKDSEMRVLISLLDKYVDARPARHSKIPETFVRRRQVESVMKTLQLHAGIKPHSTSILEDTTASSTTAPPRSIAQELNASNPRLSSGLRATAATSPSSSRTACPGITAAAAATALKLGANRRGAGPATAPPSAAARIAALRAQKNAATESTEVPDADNLNLREQSLTGVNLREASMRTQNRARNIVEELYKTGRL